MDLGCCLDEVLQVCPEKEVAQVDKLAVVLVLHVDDTPPVLAAPNLLTIDNDRLLGTDDGERNQVLQG